MNTHELPLVSFTTILRQRSRLVLGCALLAALLAFVGASLLPARYTAKALLLIETGSGRPIPGQLDAQQQAVDESTILTEVTALSAHDLLAAARLRLAQDKVFTTPVFAVDRPDAGATTLTKWLFRWQHHARLVLDEGLASLGWQPATAPRSPQVPSMRDLENHLKVFQEIGSQVVAVSYTASDPRVAAAVANGVADLYVAGRVRRARNDIDTALATVSAALPHLAATLHDQETAAVTYQTAHGYLGEARPAVIEQKLADLARQNANAQANLAASRARLGSLDALAHGYRDWNAFLNTQDGAQLIELRHRLQALLQSPASQLASLTAPVDLGASQIVGAAPLRASLRNEITVAGARLRNDVAVAQSRANVIAHQLASSQEASSDVTLQTLMDNASATRARLKQLRQRRVTLLDERDSLLPPVRVLSAAPVPDRPSSPSAFLFIPPAAVLGGVIGMFLAIIGAQADRSIRTEQQIAAFLGWRCAGMVPEVRLRKGKRPHELMLAEPMSAYAEAIRTTLAAIEPGPRAKKMGRAIMVTSSVPQEGKTTLAVSLATYAASLGRRVLLLDLDFRHPAIAREIGPSPDADTVTLLSGSGALMPIVQSHHELRLDYLPVHESTMDPLKLLGSQRFGQLMQTLRSEYDQIVIDTAPLLAVADSGLVVPFVDRVLFAVRWNSTSRDLVMSSAEHLRRGLRRSERSGIDVAVVLTRVDLRAHARGGYGDRGEVLAAYARGTSG